MKTHRTLRKVLAFFKRDVAIARSYRMAFALEILEAFFGVATFYYLSRFVSNDRLARVLPAGSDYFAFALVGFAFFDYLTVSLSAFDNSIMEARQNGTLEAMLVSETPLTMILIASAAYPFVLLALRTVIYLAWGAALFHFPIRGANWLGAAIILTCRFWRLPAWGLSRRAISCCSNVAILPVGSLWALPACSAASCIPCRFCPARCSGSHD